MFTLGRKIDMTYKTNKWIAIISFTVAIIGIIITRKLASGLSIGLGTFITWALAREVDPKNEYSAFICAGFSLLNLFYFQEIQLFVLFYILLILRLVSGITGKRITVLDVLIVFGSSLFLSITHKNNIYIIPFIIAIISIKRIEGEDGRVKVYKTALVISVTIYLIESLYFKLFTFNKIDFSNWKNVLILITAIIFIIFRNFIKIEGTYEDQGNPINKKRVRLSQTIYGIIVLLLVLFTDMSLNNLIIYFSIISGIIIYSFFIRILR